MIANIAWIGCSDAASCAGTRSSASFKAWTVRVSFHDADWRTARWRQPLKVALCITPIGIAT
jgi:hypothetical protein